LFKISDFVLGGKEIATSLYSSLEKTEIDSLWCIQYSELAVSPFFSDKVMA
jgi:hypothetical protein